MYRLRDGDASYQTVTLPCPTSFGPWEVVQGKEPTCTKAGDEASLLQYMQQVVCRCPRRQRATAGISTIQKSLPAPRQENTTPTAGIALRARGAPQNLPRVTSGSSGSEYLLHAPRRDIPNLSATTAARMGGPPRRPPRGTASARGLPRRRPPARRKACRSGSAQRCGATESRGDRQDGTTNSARGSPQRSPPAWRPASKSGSVHNAV